jgi:hypothetical protein
LRRYFQERLAEKPHGKFFTGRATGEHERLTSSEGRHDNAPDSLKNPWRKTHDV